MNNDEFGRWARHHASLFPSWGDNRRNLVNAAEAAKAMAKLLSGVDYEDCVQASSDMSEGVIQKPISYDDHVFTIRSRALDLRFARQPKRKWIEQTEVFKCANCRDTGWRYRATDKTVDLAKAGVYDELIEYWCQFHDRVRPMVTDAMDGRISYSQMTAMIRESKPASETRPTINRGESFRYQLIACDCFVGSRHSTIRFNKSLHCPWEAGDLDYRNLIAARNFECGNDDLANAINEFNSEMG